MKPLLLLHTLTLWLNEWAGKNGVILIDFIAWHLRHINTSANYIHLTGQSITMQHFSHKQFHIFRNEARHAGKCITILGYHAQMGNVTFLEISCRKWDTLNIVPHRYAEPISGDWSLSSGEILFSWISVYDENPPDIDGFPPCSFQNWSVLSINSKRDIQIFLL